MGADEQVADQHDLEGTVAATDALMQLSRTMTAVVARTLADVADEVTVPQLRVMVLLSSRGPMNLSAIAEHLGVNPSNASRTCAQLETSGRVCRAVDERDRRTVILRPTAEGAAFVERLMGARRDILAGVVDRMATEDRDQLTHGLRAFTAAVAAGPPDERIGLPDGRLIPWLL